MDFDREHHSGDGPPACRGSNASGSRRGEQLRWCSILAGLSVATSCRRIACSNGGRVRGGQSEGSAHDRSQHSMTRQYGTRPNGENGRQQGSIGGGAHGQRPGQPQTERAPMPSTRAGASSAVRVVRNRDRADKITPPARRSVTRAIRCVAGGSVYSVALRPARDGVAWKQLLRGRAAADTRGTEGAGACCGRRTSTMTCRRT